MISSRVSTENQFITIIPKVPRFQKSSLKPVLCSSLNNRIHNNDNNSSSSRGSNSVSKFLNSSTKAKTAHVLVTTTESSSVSLRESERLGSWGGGGGDEERRRDFGEVGINNFNKQMLVLCGLGYWVQGFRCFPWLALNFHMAHNLSLHPSTLQLVQNSGNLPMVAKPLYGILSDALYIGGAHRIPYICIGVAAKALPNLMACVLLSNLGASITEVAKDALVAEYGQKNGIVGLQSYAFMAAASGGILGNLFGGYFLLKTPPTTMFLVFAVLLSLQLAISFSAREESLGLAQVSYQNVASKSIAQSIKKQFSDLIATIGEESISYPLTWLVASVAMVPVLSGSMFCYQTQCLNINPSVIGMSRVIGQSMLLSLTVFYDRYWKKVPLRKLVGAVQILYASSLLLDLILVRQINLQFGVPNEVFVLCFAGLAETLAQFKLLPFSMLLARLCPQGCEGSLTSFSASALCLSSIASGFLGVGLASLTGITFGDYSSLPVGIVIQFLAALLPLIWIHHVPMSETIIEKGRKRGMSRRTRKNRRVGRVVIGSIFIYRRERESEAQG
ncbi:hypothetical protein WN943_029270 [Citrus x changshan-huyou]|uniref:Folate-biopterin transporter 8 n=1 Tax=Citrus sinensis TaxID=2711 RepID=A0ACB8I561_CITSI|nr:putative folate-biopterin transporter 8 [Citrus sinensis]